MPTVAVLANSPQHIGTPFVVTVVVSGAPAGAAVKVALIESPDGQSWGPQSQVAAGVDLFFSFNVTINSNSVHTFTAHVSDDKNTFYPPASADVDVR